MQDGTYDAVLQLLEVKGRKAGNSYVYDCKFSDNTTKSLWDADMARQISELKDGPAFPLRYTVKHNTRNNRTFENMTIEAFALPGDELPFSPDAQAAPAAEAVAAEQAEAKKSGGQSGGYGQWDEVTTARVSKLACIEHATRLVGQIYQGAGPEALEQALADVKRVGGELYKLARKHEQAKSAEVQAATTQPEPEPEKIQPTATTAAEVAQAVPGVVVGTSAVAETSAQPEGSGGMSPEDWD